MDQEKLVLYRGDYEKIKAYDIKKTLKWCLVGPGIYLTTSAKVAESYRDKGSPVSNNETLFSGFALNRPAAYEKAFKGYCENRFYQEKIYNLRRLQPKEEEKYYQKYRSEYERLIEEGLVVASYEPAPYNSKPVDPKARYMKVIYYRGKIGFITKFEFNRRYFESNIIHVDRPMDDPEVWKLFYEKGILAGSPYQDVSSYVNGNLGTKITSGIARSETKWKQIIDALKPFGIIGFEYFGGVRVGGYGYHRAFSIWDDEYVNKHRVDRFR